MSNKHNNQSEAQPQQTDDIEINEVDNITTEEAEVEELKDDLQTEEDVVAQLEKKLAETQAELEKEKKEYLFLRADFDNYRKRTLKEKSELIKNAAENTLNGMLPVVDDFERSIQAMADAKDVNAVKEGVELIYNKFLKYLEQNGVKPIDSSVGTPFDTELHDAVTAFPVQDEAQKDKVIDTVQKGYTLHDKVMRHAKVVVGK